MIRLSWQINLRRFPYLTPEELEALVAAFRAGEGKTIKDNPGRTVKEMACGGPGTVFVKQTKINRLPETVKHFFLPGRISTEWRIMNRAAELGIPTACPVALGIDCRRGRLREAFLVSQSLGDMLTLHSYFQKEMESASPDQAVVIKNELLRGLAHFLHSLHQGGVVHHDLHIENILVPAQAPAFSSFYLIDLYKVEIRTNLDLSARTINLARLVFSTAASRILSREEQAEFIRHYYSLDAVTASDLPSLQDAIFRRVEKLSQQRIKSRGRKSFRPGKFFAHAGSPGEFIIYRREFPVATLSPILSLHHEITRPFREIAHPHPGMLPPAVLKASRRSIVTRLDLGNPPAQSFCVKEERNDPENPSFRFFLTRSRNRKSWKNSNKMLLRDLPAPKCLALQENRRWGLRVRSHLVMEYLVGLVPLNTYIFRTFNGHRSPSLFQKKRKFLSFLAQFVRTLHEKGVYQGDFKSNNLLLREQGDFAWEGYLVDLDRVHFGKNVSLSHRIRNLAQLNASVAECIGHSDRALFLREYDAKGQWDKKRRKEISRKILAICRKRKTDFYGVSFDKGPRSLAAKARRV